MTAVRFRSTVIDCPDPLALAGFYAGVLGGTLRAADDEWVVLDIPDGPRIAFQRVPEAEYTPPEWPRADRPQQFHLDFDAGSTWEEIEAAEKAVLALGARLLERQDKEDFRVYADPVGHPFCLCRIDH